MDINEILSLYCSDSELQQAKFLSCLAHQITIFARDTYEPDTDALSNPTRLRCINEMMHRILGQQFKLLLGDRERYPDDVFIKMVFDMAATCGFEDYLSLGISESAKWHMSGEASNI